MAQSHNCLMEREDESLYDILHNQLSPLGTNAVNKFFGRDNSGKHCIDVQTCTPSPQKIQISTQPDPQELVIHHLLFRAPGICGRGTTCWEAHFLGGKDQNFLIKDSWQPLDQIPEGQMLCDVRTRNVPNVARYHHHEDVHVNSKIVDIKSYVRENLEFMKCEKIEISGQSDEAKEPKNGFINRFQRRLILKDVGRPIWGPIWEVKTAVHLSEALEGCIKGHRALLNAGYLHRDISTNNLMINNQTDDPDRKSFLIDLDHAIPYPITNDQVHHKRAGTKLFMKECYLSEWHRTGPESLKGEKRDLLAHPDELTDEFSPLYSESKPLIACVHRFAEIMRNSLVREEESATLYDKILNLLRQAR
ncbi:hypothetical protein PSHT_02913 [Puccinia striiformis]|uniref:Fungal-type protein kinase domain-containing protein n=1 Tax=Puccinia striiformis TaxID=27350 RepID=A0A2S4WH57_9BASI|nr:hypothetical protein PSHT_02913 [Puccinia striiformis]